MKTYCSFLFSATCQTQRDRNKVTNIFSKMMKLYGEELFALGGESSHFKKDVDSVREIFTLFFKDIKEKYLPMIEL